MGCDAMVVLSGQSSLLMRSSRLTLPSLTRITLLTIDQVSGQGPYFGQATWFKNFHPEKLPGVIDRYQNEIRRVTMVLDRHLADKEWLVGGKCSYADLSFIPWYWALVGVGEEFIAALTKDYPNWSAWNERLNARPVVKKAAETRRANFTAKQGQLQRGGFSNVK